MMNLIVYSISGPAFQPVKDGKPYNKYVATIQFSDRDRYGCRWYKILSGDTAADVERQMDKYMVGAPMRVSEKEVFVPNIKEARKCNRTTE